MGVCVCMRVRVCVCVYCVCLFMPAFLHGFGSYVDFLCLFLFERAKRTQLNLGTYFEKRLIDPHTEILGQSWDRTTLDELTKGTERVKHCTGHLI